MLERMFFICLELIDDEQPMLCLQKRFCMSSGFVCFLKSDIGTFKNFPGSMKIWGAPARGY
jgi:hypothetical protein